MSDALPSLANLPAGVIQTTVGDAEAMGELAQSFVLAMLTGVACIYIVLVLLFHAFVQPVTILAALVLSIPGAILALFVARTDLSMPSMIGMVMLMGIATKNSILLVDYVVMARRDHGLNRWDALLDACSKRARPIVMTTIAMGAGMLPIAIGFGADPSFRAPMAIVVIGGLITSTFLSLLVIPVVFTYVDDLVTWMRGWRAPSQRRRSRHTGRTCRPSLGLPWIKSRTRGAGHGDWEFCALLGACGRWRSCRRTPTTPRVRPPRWRKRWSRRPMSRSSPRSPTSTGSTPRASATCRCACTGRRRWRPTRRCRWWCSRTASAARAPATATWASTSPHTASPACTCSTWAATARCGSATRSSSSTGCGARPAKSEAVQRVRDLSFALDELLERSDYGARIDRTRIAAAGHSYGANTVMLAAGATLQRNGRSVHYREPRIRAALLLSAPPFYGEPELNKILGAVTLPSLHITATDDVIRVPGYYSPPDDRLAVFDAAGSKAKALAVFEGGSHSIFTDRAGQRRPGAESARQRRDAGPGAGLPAQRVRCQRRSHAAVAG